ncbi:MAG TPA: hypothetical protein VN420_03920 [Candidatus Fimivivens sp.]|nr:hypothetical protein [Candidatus Fimivivens sp.]
MEKKNIAIAVLSALLIILGAAIVYLVFNGKGKETPSIPKGGVASVSPVPANADVSARVADSQSTVAPSATKRYENRKYGFSFDMPGNYWYEEGENKYHGEGPGPTATLLYNVEVDDPRLTPEPIGTFDGTTHTPKFGTLLWIGVHDKSGGIVPPNGLDYAKAIPVTVGGLSGTRYDDTSYSLLGKNFVYSIDLYSSETGATETPEMKKAFEDIVKTFKFE